jgi:uncharacterized membrane protein YfcA
VADSVTLAQAAFLFGAAFVAGVLNAVAFGGSFISFPALLFTAMPPINANATNTAALWPGTIASTGAYRRVFTGDVLKLLPPGCCCNCCSLSTLDISVLAWAF